MQLAITARWPFVQRIRNVVPPPATVTLPAPRAADLTPQRRVRGDGFFSTAAMPRPQRGGSEWDREFQALAMPRSPNNLRSKDGAVWAMDGMEFGGGFNGLFNVAYGGVPEAQAAWYGLQGFIGYNMCAILDQQWLVNAACARPGEDATRNGYKVTLNDGVEAPAGMIDYIRQRDKHYDVIKNCCEASRFLRVYGVRVVVFIVDSADPFYYEKPFNPDGIAPGSYQGISQIDPYWITPELDSVAAADPASKRFYQPTYWRISGKRYHYTHLVVLKRNEPADVLKPTYFYGGIPLTQQIYERVYASERTANEAPQLALTKRTNVVHVDLAAMASNQIDMTKRLDDYAYYRDNYGVKVLGTEETMEQFDTSLSEFDNTIMVQFQLVAAIARVPATKLLGTQPKGFNATGEFDEASYHETLESVQTHEMSPIVERHHVCLMRSEVQPKYQLPKPIPLTVEWEDLDAETSLEAATRRKTDSETAKNYADTGAIGGEDIRERLIKDPDSGFDGLPWIAPEQAEPLTVVQPNAPKVAPNTLPGATPTPAPAAAPGDGGGSP